MNNVIEFKKDCIMKTMISEITDISLTHDYKVLDDTIEGYFDVSGEYKITKASALCEEFMFTIPFSIALSSLIDRNSINLTIKDFNYSVEKDIMHLNMSLNLDYKEIEIVESIEESKEEVIEESISEAVEEEEIMETVEEMLESIPEVPLEENPVFHNEIMNMQTEEEVIDIQDKKEAEESIKSILSDISSEESYYKYKVYIMREEDTIESVAIKYNVTLDDLKEYNSLESINVGDKIVIPFVNVVSNEQDK